MEYTEIMPTEVTRENRSSANPGYEDDHEMTEDDRSRRTSPSNNKLAKEENKPVSYRKLFRYADSWDWTCIAMGTLAATVHGAALPIMFIFFGDLTERFIEYGRYQQCSFSYNACFALNVTTLNETQWSVEIDSLLGTIEQDSIDRVYYFIYLACLAFVLGTIQVLLFSLQSVRQARRLRIEYFRAILRQDIAYHDITSSGELNARLSSDIKKAKDGMGEKVSFVIQYVSMTLTGVIIGIVYTWKLGLVALSVAPILVLSGALLFKLSDVYTKKEQSAYSRAGCVAEEAISSMRTVAAFGCQRKVAQRYEDSMKGARKAATIKGFMSGLGIGLLYISMFAMYGLSFWYGSTLVINREINAGQMTTSFFGILVASFALGTAASYLGTFSEARAAIKNILEVIDREPDINVFSDQGTAPDSISGDITFDEVTFAYPTRPDVEVLVDVSFTVEHGQTVALVGHSGCGKSTVMQMIQRFYDPKSGKISIEGQNIQTMPVRSLRETIGVVCQEPVLFATTIAENIRWGRDGVTDEQIELAAKRANAYGFISRFPKKFGTLVGESGSQLSGGQKQRISIARAIVRDPKILLLDEATSALDSANERAVQQALHAACKDRTTIVVAHRLSTIRYADKIIVLQDGKVMEQGSHSKLLQKNGFYATFHRIQNEAVSDSRDDLTQEDEAVEDHIESRHFKRNASCARASSNKWNRTWSTRILKKQTSLSLIPCNYAPDITSPDPIFSPSTRRRLPSDIESEITVDLNPECPDAIEVSFWKLLKMNSTEWPFITAGCFFAAVAGAVDPVNAIVFARVLAIFVIPDLKEQQDLAVLYGLLFVALGVVSFFAFTTEATLFAKSGVELTLRLRRKAFAAILRQEISFFDETKNNTGVLCNRLASDALRVQGCTGARLGIIIKNFSSLGVALAIGFIYSWKLTLVTLGFIPFIILGAIIEMQMIVGEEDDEKVMYEDASQVATEAIKNIRTVASLSAENQVRQMYESKLKSPTKKARRKALLIGVGYGYSQTVIFLVAAATFRLGIELLINNETLFENVFKVLTAVFFGALAVGQNSSYAPDYAEAKVSAARLFSLFSHEPEIDATSTAGHSPAGCQGTVTFRSVAFSYPSRPDVKVLKDFNITLEPGKTLALVGQSGCGKSTIVQLLERFYDPQAGQILIDGTDIRDFNVSWLRQQIGLVSQEPVLFNDTIRENIAFGDQSRTVSDEKIEDAAEQANARQFISKFCRGFDTLAGEKGGQISGGQKQRVAIARALLRKPKILILDEATSALDVKSEKLVQDALDAARSGRTTILIAHRLSTVKDADVIAVIDRGRVVEMGNHESLLRMRGLYYSLHNTQCQPSRGMKQSSSSLF